MLNFETISKFRKNRGNSFPLTPREYFTVFAFRNPTVDEILFGLQSKPFEMIDSYEQQLGFVKIPTVLI